MREENQTIIKALNMFGRVPETWELLNEIERLNNIIDDKKERQEIAIRLLHKLFGTDDYEINYIIGIINGQRQINFDEELFEITTDKKASKLLESKGE